MGGQGPREPCVVCWAALEPELWASIFSHIVDLDHQAACMLVSKGFHTAGLGTFPAFHSISVTAKGSKEISALSSLLYKLCALKASPKLKIKSDSRHTLTALSFAMAFKLQANLQISGGSIVTAPMESWIDLASSVRCLILLLPKTSPLWDEWMQQRVFDRFVNLHVLGTGLGVAPGAMETDSLPTFTYTLDLPHIREWATDLTTLVPQPWVAILDAALHSSAAFSDDHFPSVKVTRFRGLRGVAYQPAPASTQALILQCHNSVEWLQRLDELPPGLKLLACRIAPGIKPIELPSTQQHRNVTTLFLDVEPDCLLGMLSPSFGCMWPPLTEFKACFPSVRDVVVRIYWADNMATVPPDIPPGLGSLCVQYVMNKQTQRSDRFADTVTAFTTSLLQQQHLPANLCVDSAMCLDRNQAVTRVRHVKAGFQHGPEQQLLGDWPKEFHLGHGKFHTYVKQFVGIEW